MKCCLCGKKIEIKGTWTDGNNAEPIKNGRCCYKCNDEKAIPARLFQHKRIIWKNLEKVIKNERGETNDSAGWCFDNKGEGNQR